MVLLIVPYGIETLKAMTYLDLINHLLIVPYGIETLKVKYMKIVLILF